MNLMSIHEWDQDLMCNNSAFQDPSQTQSMMPVGLSMANEIMPSTNYFNQNPIPLFSLNRFVASISFSIEHFIITISIYLF
jgi:hypothetical protein